MRPDKSKYIADHAGKESVRDIARATQLTENEVRRFIEKELPGLGRPSETTAPAVTPAAFESAPVRTSPTAPARANTALWLFLLLALTAGAYSSSLNGQFIFDDENLVKHNAYLGKAADLPRLFTENIGAGSGIDNKFYRPAQMLTHWADVALWRMDVRGHHLTNILLHALAAFCVFAFARTLLRDPLTAFLAAALFAVHPLHTEAVAYISGRADMLVTFFMLLALIFYDRGEPSVKKGFPLAALLCYAGALLSKEYALIFPLLLWWHQWALRKAVDWRRLWPFAAAAAVYGTLRLTVLRFVTEDASLALAPSPFMDRLSTSFYALGKYAQLLFVPKDLHMEYGAGGFGMHGVLGALGLVLLIAGAAYWAFSLKRPTLGTFCLGWAFISLFPYLNWVPINAFMAEHWLYIPSIGLFIWAAEGLGALKERPGWRTPVLVVAEALVAIYGFVTFRQNDYWREPVAFYKKTLEYNPSSARIYYNMGLLYDDNKDREQAIEWYKKTVELDSTRVNAYVNMGNMYLELKKVPEAIEQYQKALEQKPDAEIYGNLGKAYEDAGDHAKAMESFKKALELDPRLAGIYNDMAYTYNKLGRREEAIASLRKALEIDPKLSAAQINLDKLLSRAATPAEKAQ